MPALILEEQPFRNVRPSRTMVKILMELDNGEVGRGQIRRVLIGADKLGGLRRQLMPLLARDLARPTRHALRRVNQHHD
jgi:hypothetical protein